MPKAPRTRPGGRADGVPEPVEPSVRSFVAPRPPACSPASALFLDRQMELLRAICGASSPSPGLPVTTARRSLDRLRQAGASVGVASHNRGDSWETFNVDEIAVMNARIEAALGPIDLWCICLIDEHGSCACTEPSSGVVATGAQAVGVRPERCAVLSEGARMSDAAEVVGVPTVRHPATGSADLGDPRGRLTLAARELSLVVDALLTVQGQEEDRVRPGRADRKGRGRLPTTFN